MASLPTGTVTFLFTDIEGSTRLWEQHPDPMRRAVARHEALAEGVIDRHGGALVKSRGEGDSLFAVFARATDALHAACALQLAFQREPWPPEAPLRVRVALHTGEAERRGGDYFGPAVNRCARLRAAAHGGQVLLSRSTSDRLSAGLPEGCRLQDLGSHRLRDLAQPEHVFQLLHPDLPADFPPPRSLQAFANNLPKQVTSFVGREEAMDQVKRLLSASRLLTLTGAGGCGKTRLALQVAADVVEDHGDGVWLAELAALADPALVPRAVAAALGVREEPGRSLTVTLGEHLAPRAVLLVLDNCEHLLGACAALADALLRDCPRLRLLATSRERLGIAGESLYRVPSLSVPDVGAAQTVEGLPRFEAVHLFLDRALAVAPAFHLTARNGPALVQVCRKLDGIPLALELCAARTRSMAVEEINGRLSDRFRLLRGGSRTALPRHQTLRALIDWSYELLSEGEKALLGRVSVFAGGWTLAAAEAVCAGDDFEDFEVMDLLTSLVDKSLAVYDEVEDREGRYRLLETVRQYAHDRLLKSAEHRTVRDAHRDYFLTMAEEANAKMSGAEQARWLSVLEQDHANLNAALQWAHDSKPETALRLANALTWFWVNWGYYAEGERWLQEALARNPEASARLRADTLWGLALLGVWHDISSGRTFAEESLALARSVDHVPGIARALSLLGLFVLCQGDAERATTIVNEGLPLSRELGEPWTLAFSLTVEGWLAVRQHDYERATALFAESVSVGRQAQDNISLSYVLYFQAGLTFLRGDLTATRLQAEESLTLARQMGFSHGVAHALEMLGHVLVAEGDLAGARRHLVTSLTMLRERGKPMCSAHNLVGFACLALAEAQAQRAARLLGGAEAALVNSRTSLMPTERARYDVTLAAARGALSEAAFAEAWGEGRAMTLDQARDYALGGPSGGTEP